MTKARTLADMISDGVIGTTELADDVITPVKLDETGNYSMAQLGVGTASPAKRFHISTTTGTDLFRLSGVNNFNFDIESSGTGNQFDFRIGSGGGAYTFNNSNRELVKFDASGNVILNSTSVSTSDNIALRITGGSSGYSNVQFADAGDVNVGMIQYNHASNYMQFTTNDSERMRITNTGFVGIGLTAPRQLLHVNQTTASSDAIVRITNSNTPSTGGHRVEFADGTGTSEGSTVFRYGYIAGERSSGGNDGHLIFGTKPDSNTSPTERMRIDSSGRVGVNTSSPEGKGVDVVHSRSDSYSETSDQRNLAHIIARNGSDASGRFSSISLISGGGTQAEGSINLVQKGNYVGDMTFKLRAGGGSTDWRERMKIDSAGRVTKPYQPSFYAFRTGSNYSSSSSGWEKLVANGTRWNEGSHYSTSNNRFTAPIAGVYHFDANVNRYGVNDDFLLAVAIYVNGSVYAFGNRFHSRGTTDLVASMSITAKLSANDYVEVWSYSDDSGTGFSQGAMWNTFSGYLLG